MWNVTEYGQKRRSITRLFSVLSHISLPCYHTAIGGLITHLFTIYNIPFYHPITHPFTILSHTNVYHPITHVCHPITHTFITYNQCLHVNTTYNTQGGH